MIHIHWYPLNSIKKIEASLSDKLVNRAYWKATESLNSTWRALNTLRQNKHDIIVFICLRISKRELWGQSLSFPVQFAHSILKYGANLAKNKVFIHHNLYQLLNLLKSCQNWMSYDTDHFTDQLFYRFGFSSKSVCV